MTRGPRSFSSLRSVRNGFFTTLAVMVLYVGCSTENEGTGETSAGNNSPGGGFTPNDCDFGGPDGTCSPREATTCACADCSSAAACTGSCTNDGTCDNGGENPTEDCTCEDCLNIVPGCSPNLNDTCINDEDNPGACETDEPCTCSDCTDQPYCQECKDDGICNPVYEGCSCADCGCSSGSGPTTSSTTTTTSSTGGAGGTGGAGAAGGGGAGAAGGAGGAGGA